MIGKRASLHKAFHLLAFATTLDRTVSMLVQILP
jgi:hypothetical protein